MTMYNGLNNYRQFHWPIERKYDSLGNFIFEFDCYCTCGGFRSDGTLIAIDPKGDDKCAFHSQAVRHGINKTAKQIDDTKFKDYHVMFWDEVHHLDFQRGVRLVNSMHNAYYKTGFQSGTYADHQEFIDLNSWDGITPPTTTPRDPITEPYVTVDHQRHNNYYYRGIVDRKNGVDQDNSPFAVGTPEHTDWLAGFIDPYYWKK